jgi:hypothetical protein
VSLPVCWSLLACWPWRRTVGSQETFVHEFRCTRDWIKKMFLNTRHHFSTSRQLFVGITWYSHACLCRQLFCTRATIVYLPRLQNFFQWWRLEPTIWVNKPTTVRLASYSLQRYVPLRVDEFQRLRNLTYFRQFFPEPSAWEYPVSMDNMIRQWHIIEGGWKLLEKYEKKTASRYDRIGFFA